MVHCIYQGVAGLKCPNSELLQSMKMVLISENSADPVLKSWAFYKGHHCLPKYQLRGFQYTKVLYVASLLIERAFD